MVSFRTRLFLSLITVGLVSCSTMSRKECEVADWRGIGLTDGLAGRALTLFNERRSDCAEANIAADTNAYLLGREQGLRSYCQLGNAPQIGLRGDAYEGVCPAPIDPEFRRRHRIGFDVYRLSREIGRLNSRFDALEQRFHRNRHEFDRRLGAQGKNDHLPRLYREYEHEQFKIREEQQAILNALRWHQDQWYNARAVLERLQSPQ